MGIPMPREKTMTRKSVTTNCSDAYALTGRWRISNNFLCCGTLRIAAFDFDTNPSDEFKQSVFKQMLDGLNGQLEGCQAAMDGDCHSDQCPQKAARKPHCPLPHYTDDPEY